MWVIIPVLVLALFLLDSLRAPASGSDSSSPDPTGNVDKDEIRVVAYRAMISAGWGPEQWDSLDRLVNSESGWNPNAQNPHSTAYGLFQFLNATWAGTGYMKSSNPATQIAAGLKYIRNRYGSPVEAWAFWQRQSPHWY
jgi:hypothetical protein